MLDLSKSVPYTLLTSVAMFQSLVLPAISMAQVAAEFHGGSNNVAFRIGLDRPSDGLPNNAFGQTFLSHATGSLTTLAIGLNAYPSNPLDVTMTIWTTNAQNVVSQRGSATQTSAVVYALGGWSQGRPTVFDFTSLNIEIVEGTTYAWTLTVSQGTIDDGSPNSHNPFDIYGVDEHGGYNEGNVLTSGDGVGGPWHRGYPEHSINFQANYTVPAAPSLTVLAFAGLAGLRRRR
jgi:hypothetical protein